MRTVDEEQRAARRAALLDAAEACFAQRGYDATRTADVCAAAGMSAGNLFHYFPTKHDVLLAVVDRDAERTAAAVGELAHADDPWEALLALLDEVCRLAADPVAAGLALEISALAHRDEDVQQRMRAGDRAFRAALADLLAAGVRTGQVATRLAADEGATWLAALVDGVFARVAADPEFDPASQRATLRQVATALLARES
jgi:TetR/AcrR family transcriptional regulator, transcriptional repressor of aconitase